MKHLRSAIEFLTILPAGGRHAFQPLPMVTCFPLVGLLLGLLIASADLLFCALWPRSIAAVLDTILLIILTGALHIDGLGDSADGLYGQWSREKALAIMKDSRIGTMALVAIVCTLSIKWAGFSTISQHRFLVLLIIPAYARATNLFGIRLLPYARPEDGMGRALFKEPLTVTHFRYVAIPVLLSLCLGWQGMLINLVYGVTVVALIGFYRYKMGSITGDMLGAMVEITEAVLLLTASVGGQV